MDRSRSSETVYHNRTTVSTYDRIKCPSSKINHPTAEYEVRPKQKSDVSFTEETIETDQQSYSVRPVVTRTPSQVSRSDIYSSIPEWEKTQDDEPSTDGDTDSEGNLFKFAYLTFLFKLFCCLNIYLSNFFFENFLDKIMTIPIFQIASSSYAIHAER